MTDVRSLAEQTVAHPPEALPGAVEIARAYLALADEKDQLMEALILACWIPGAPVASMERVKAHLYDAQRRLTERRSAVTE